MSVYNHHVYEPEGNNTKWVSILKAVDEAKKIGDNVKLVLNNIELIVKPDSNASDILEIFILNFELKMMRLRLKSEKDENQSNRQG